MNLQAWAEKWGHFPRVLESIPGFAGHSFSCVGVTGSTNDDLKNDWVHLPVPLRVHVAAHQTSGRGQYGREWLDQPDESLLFSFSWKKPVHEVWVLPPQILAGLAVHKALEPFFREVPATDGTLLKGVPATDGQCPKSSMDGTLLKGVPATDGQNPLRVRPQGKAPECFQVPLEVCYPGSGAADAGRPLPPPWGSNGTVLQGELAPWLKWPNDVWAGRGKLAGILAEATICGDIQSIIIGIGLNLKGKPDLAGHDQRAVSLGEFGLTCEAETILEAILRSWDHFLKQTDVKALVAEYHRRAGVFFSGKVQVKVTGNDGLVGVPSNLDEAGGLWIDAKKEGRRLLDDARRIQLLFD